MNSEETESSYEPLPELKDIEPCITIFSIFLIIIFVFVALGPPLSIQAGLVSITFAILVLACQVYKLDHKSD